MITTWCHHAILITGLHVSIDCKPENGENFERRGVGEVNGEGKFTVSLPQELLKVGKLKEECYAQLHDASATPCAAHDGLESTKIVFKSKTNDKHTFGVGEKLRFSPVTCTSAFLWPHYKHPPLPKFKHPFFKHPIFKGHDHHHSFPPIHKPEPKPKPHPKPEHKPKPHPVHEPEPHPVHEPEPHPHPHPYHPLPPFPKLPPLHHHHPISGKFPPPLPPYSPIH